MILPLFFAIVVNRFSRGQWFFRLAFFLPYILPSAVIAWPFLAATSPTMMTIPAGLGTVVSGTGIVFALQMASSVLGALPLVLVFLLAQRQIVEGVAGTGLK